MTDFRLADALDKAAEALAEAAMILRIGPETSQDAPSDMQAPSFEELPFDDFGQQEIAADTRPEELREPHGSAAVCPKHGVAYRRGKFGFYCSTPSDDPDWRNDKGWCSITPKNAAVYMRQKAVR